MADIFVSYASEDRDRILRLVEALESQGWSVWWDRELITGPSFDDKIEAALDEARCVVVGWSEHSIQSRWVRTEANEGLARGILVPALIDDVRPPLAFRISQTANLIGWPSDRGEVDSLIGGIRELLGSATSDTKARPTSVAVLPFVNMSSDPEQEFFSDGMAEEVINGLVNLGKFKVIARTSSFKFKGRNEDVRDIGRALDVSHVLEGSVRKSGQRLRVTAQLIDTEDGSHLWSERFDRELIDVFQMQDEITEAIVEALQGELAPDAPKSTGTQVMEAYDAYLNGRYHLAQGSTLVTYLAALKELKRAVELDPGFADAWGALTTTYFGLGFWNPPARMELIEEAVEKALSVDPRQPDARLTEASLYLYRDYDIHKAIEAWHDVIESRPNDVLAMYRLYIGLMSLGLNDIPLLNRLMELDPLFQTHHRHRGFYHMKNGRYTEAIRDAERALELEPNDPLSLSLRARSAQAIGNEEVWTDSVDKIRALVGERSTFYAQLTDNKQLGRDILDDPAAPGRNPPMNLAGLASWVGDMDTAMKWFARAADRGDFAATQQCRMWMRGPSVADEDIRDQRYAEVAAREDYQAIMRRLRLDDESVADLLDAYPGERL